MTTSTPPRILVFAGSARENSFNKRLARLAAERVEHAGGQATFIDLRDYPLPLYDGDLENREGLPASARSLQGLLADHQGLLLASPEYNGFITPLMKNTLDWMSRSDGERSGLALFTDQVAAVVSASPGALGGMRSLALIRQLLSNLGVTVLPSPLAVPRAAQAFGEDGQLADESQRERLDALCQRLVTTLAKLHAADSTSDS
ncbi:NAD(P)H-dependent oxidoreductase [Halomonas sp. MCCC 1A17488]|uniref:NADPH-dependent FMN reductase n=1 Tax=unclassified Halomonas TaxID=2609666 RepID=UPI0018D24FB0|nr:MULTISPECIES: NAD(P)H-dependent oxidoreductase [unclassified Halomonas]MCE8015450.1 NAD(P)H-dependent oxidoreductase [Halomonas sp. MCCC 1A17488]MCG3238783.1 NAD(P)H-dependent oxidoreductase [Halomonas sp. MCCC 1A17488]QPP51251.1 NAD(P)H-dependent oxidoreductase [Halomonas sp. SS10-MC5]